MKTLRLGPQFGACALAMLVAGGAVVRAAEPTSPKAKRNVEIEWDAVEGATAYEVRVTRADGAGRPLTFRMTSAHWSANVKPGPYLMELRTYDDRGVPGEWSPKSELVIRVPAAAATTPAANAVVDARRADQDEVTLAWAPIPGAKDYQVKIEGEGFARTLDVTGTSVAVEVPVARTYRWSVVGRDDTNARGEVAPTIPFTFRGPALRRPSPERPLSRYVDRVGWDEVPDAESYETDLRVYNARARTWDPVANPATATSTNELPFDVSRPRGRYRLGVRAVAKNRLPSPRAEVTFDVAGGFGDADAMRDAQGRDSLFKPSPYSSFAVLRIGTAAYRADNADLNSIASFDAPTAGLAAGVVYDRRESRWGGAARLNVGGLTVNGRTSRYGGVDASVSRRFDVGARSLAWATAGGFFRQVPAIAGSPTDGFLNVTPVTQNGLSLGGALAHPLTEHWSVGADLRTHVGLDKTLSYEFGLSVNWRYGRRWTLTGGLERSMTEAARAAQTGAQSFATPGAMNRVRIESTTLNLGAAFGF